MANENETVEEVCEAEIKSKLQTYNDKDRLIGFVQRILVARKRELAEKDEIIEAMRQWNKAQVDELIKRYSLIKELADALEKLERIGVDCACCGIPCDRNDLSKGCVVDELGSLVAKAREVLGVAAETQDKEVAK